VTQQQDASSPEPPPAVDTESAKSRGVVSRRQIFLAGPNSSIGKLFGLLGPGLVTGAADDDPSGIATYSQIGAQFGYTLLWTMLFIYPFMTSIQEISARLDESPAAELPATSNVFILRGSYMGSFCCCSLPTSSISEPISALWAPRPTCW
jgi:hypothetical protein